MTLRQTSIDGTTIVHEERGAGTRPLVLVHGYTGFWQDFELPLDALAAEGRVLLPDLPGHGASGRLAPEDYSLDTLAELLDAWLEKTAQEPCDLLGHSMGGMLALRVALERPERIASLILMDTTHEPLGWIQVDLVAMAARVGREAGMDKLAAILRQRSAEDPERSEADRRVEAEWGEERFWAWRDARIEAMDPEAYDALGRAMAETPSLGDRLGEIHCPTLVMVGSDDASFLEPSRELAAKIPNAELVLLANGAHQPQNECTEAWLTALRAHLEKARSA